MSTQLSTGTRRRHRPLDAKTSLMDAAESEMGIRGVDAVSVSDLVAASGCPNGSLYHHFGSKTGLLVAVLDRGFRRVHAEVREALSTPVSDTDGMAAFYEAVARSVDAHPNFHRLVIFVLLHPSGDPVDSVVEPYRSALLRDGAEQVGTTLAAHGIAASQELSRDIAVSMNAWLIGLFIVRAPDIPSRVRGQVRALVSDVVSRAPLRS